MSNWSTVALSDPMYELYGIQNGEGEVFWFSTPLPFLWRQDGPIKRMLGMAEIRLPRVGWAGDS